MFSFLMDFSYENFTLAQKSNQVKKGTDPFFIFLIQTFIASQNRTASRKFLGFIPVFSAIRLSLC